MTRTIKYFEPHNDDPIDIKKNIAVPTLGTTIDVAGTKRRVIGVSLRQQNISVYVTGENSDHA